KNSASATFWKAIDRLSSLDCPLRIRPFEGRLPTRRISREMSQCIPLFQDAGRAASGDISVPIAQSQQRPAVQERRILGFWPKLAKETTEDPPFRHSSGEISPLKGTLPVDFLMGSPPAQGVGTEPH